MRKRCKPSMRLLDTLDRMKYSNPFGKVSRWGDGSNGASIRPAAIACSYPHRCADGIAQGIRSRIDKFSNNFVPWAKSPPKEGPPARPRNSWSRPTKPDDFSAMDPYVKSRLKRCTNQILTLERIILESQTKPALCWYAPDMVKKEIKTCVATGSAPHPNYPKRGGSMQHGCWATRTVCAKRRP